VLTNARQPNSIKKLKKEKKKARVLKLEKETKKKKELIQAKEFKDQSLETPLHNSPPPQLITRVSGSSCEHKSKVISI